MIKKTNTFQDLIVWQKAHELVLKVYEQTKLFPKEELFGLVGQFRRAAVSVTANIAEGYRKSGKKDKIRYLNIAQGSLEECRYYLILSKDLKYLDNEATNVSLVETSKLLTTYTKALVNSDN